MPITLRCPLCNSSGQICRTTVLSKATANGNKKGKNETNLTTRYYVRCSDPECFDKDGSPPRWNMTLEFSGWAYDPLTPIFDTIQSTQVGFDPNLLKRRQRTRQAKYTDQTP
jgi:hypothetical protein